LPKQLILSGAGLVVAEKGKGNSGNDKQQFDSMPCENDKKVGYKTNKEDCK